MIEKIKVTDVTVVGSIREAMPTATRAGKGAYACCHWEESLSTIYTIR